MLSWGIWEKYVHLQVRMPLTCIVSGTILLNKMKNQFSLGYF